MPLRHAHLLNYGPKPAFKLQQLVCIFPCEIKQIQVFAQYTNSKKSTATNPLFLNYFLWKLKNNYRYETYKLESWTYTNKEKGEKHTGLIIEGGEADEHLDVDLSTAIDQQPEVLSCQVLQGVFRKHIQQTLPHRLGDTNTTGMNTSTTPGVSARNKHSNQNW